jgi:hypothetical protein
VKFFDEHSNCLVDEIAVKATLPEVDILVVD